MKQLSRFSWIPLSSALLAACASPPPGGGLGPPPDDDVPVFVTFEGVVTQVIDHGGYLDGLATVGMRATGRMAYDTTPADANPSQNHGKYIQTTNGATYGLHVTLTSSLRLEPVPPIAREVNVKNGYFISPGDHFSMEQDGSPATTNVVAPHDKVPAQLDLHDTSETAFNSDAAPTSLELGGFSTAQLYFGGVQGTAYIWYVNIELDKLTTP